MIPTSPPSSARSSFSSAVSLRVGESPALRRLTRYLPLALLMALSPGALGGSPAHLAALPSLVMLHRMLRSLDPAGAVLRSLHAAQWMVLCPRDAHARRCELRRRGGFLNMLWLELVPVDGSRRRHLALFGDALGNDDWRRLRRYLRVTGQGMTGAPVRVHGAGVSTVSTASGSKPG